MSRLALDEAGDRRRAARGVRRSLLPVGPAGRFLAWSASVFALCMGLVAGLNYTVDREGLYALQRAKAVEVVVPAYVERLRHSRFGLVDIGYNRAVKLALVRGATADCYVLGSSHVMSIGAADGVAGAEACRNLVNAGVSNGAVEDLVTFLGEVVDKPETRTVLIGIDPWTLKRNTDLRWTEYAAAHLRARQRFGLPNESYAGVSNQMALTANLFTLQYFVANLETLWRRARHGDERLAFKEASDVEGSNRTGTEALLRNDGSFVYHRNYIDRAAENGLLGADNKIVQPLFDGLAEADLATALRHVLARGIAVQILLMPYNPRVFACANGEVCAALAEAEPRIRKFAAGIGVPVAGSFDGRRLGLSPEDFYDAQHLAPAAFRKVR